MNHIHPQHSHDGEWNRYILYCKDFWIASTYAADRGWWLHCWKHQVDDDAPYEVIEIDLWDKTHTPSQ